ncbi:LacI family DNA-binding transcriptional regulator [Propioniciclava coleopterorum]|uniref:LacI family DNA-binding transcriptional regulator n=1 Tax=Propioniciclava coleopterorum TaxID=2714937 RepID=UPI001FE55717|nr:LacI family DNA-binding transcriptional regulator [Propioniciclava coleopterorum]
MTKITAKSVALAAGVSPSSVSNAYNRPDQLSADVRERILAVAAELGYHGPDPAGRALRSGRAGAIGVLMTQHNSYAFSDPYAIGFLRGLAEELTDGEVGILLLPRPRRRCNAPRSTPSRACASKAPRRRWRLLWPAGSPS